MKWNGSDQVRLTTNQANDREPAWSPDGEKIAFASNRDGNHEIYVMWSNGVGVARLTDHPAGDWSPAWSGDGTKIAFVSNRDGNSQIYEMNANGTGVAKLVTSTYNDSDPCYEQSLTSRRLVFNRTYSIWVTSGNSALHVDTEINANAHPDLSPDGKLAFTGWFRNASTGEGTRGEIYLRANNEIGAVQEVNLTGNPAQDEEPTWGTDGTEIAFTRDVNGNSEIFVMSADGSGQTNLTNHPGHDSQPDWGFAPRRP